MTPAGNMAGRCVRRLPGEVNDGYPRNTMSDGDRKRWEERYQTVGAHLHEPSSFLVSLDDVLPRAGRALDVAGGAGRHAVWLAQRGLAVTVCDISETALSLANAAAAAANLSVETVALDLEQAPLPAGPWAVVLSFHYLQRDLFERWPLVLAPGGLLVFVQQTRSNLERHPKPGSSHLLADGELPGLVRGLEVLRYEEGWLDEDRHEARLVARRP